MTTKQASNKGSKAESKTESKTGGKTPSTNKPTKKGTKKDTSHYYVDGYVSDTGTLGIIAYPNAFKGTDTEWTTFYMLKDEDWGYEKYDFDGRSVVSRPFEDDRAWWLLGKRGDVVEILDQDRHEQIPDAGTGPNRYGYVNKIALIEGELYVCGYARQVYRRQQAQWVHIDQGMIAGVDSVGVSLESMDGRSHRDIYAVGLKGEMWHYDGKHWDQIDSPTNQHLMEVYCTTSHLTYAVGKGGVVVRGNGTRWEVLQNPAFAGDLWGVVAFRDEIYVAGFDGLARIDGNDIVPIDTGLGKPTPGYRLRTGPPGVLWSIGNDHLLRFDGQNWEEIVCPDNQ
jgi:hypothetical protein